ncbi:hypothetical protein [Candidatus Cyanaurora vandensis]|uniref:hypothetical protein n=1 Tax=Candidatus Cyanaurora vandensis TaxID=2714958 RepID=UPI00257A11B6|nr:hypothetical protein [Candidatus Cyanaurora vandensis]
MNLAEAIYSHSLNFLEAATRQALDFIEFLEQRYSISTDTQNNTEAFLTTLVGGLRRFS